MFYHIANISLIVFYHVLSARTGIVDAMRETLQTDLYIILQ